MIYGYVRVSTRKQVDGYGLEVQKNDILSKYPTAIIYYIRRTIYRDKTR